MNFNVGFAGRDLGRTVESLRLAFEQERLDHGRALFMCAMAQPSARAEEIETVRMICRTEIGELVRARCDFECGTKHPPLFDRQRDVCRSEHLEGCAGRIAET